MNNQGKLITGILVGIGTSFGAYYLYNKNKSKIHDFLRSQGIPVPDSDEKGLESLNLEELVGKKEHIEDLIAEMEQKLKEEKKGKG